MYKNLKNVQNLRFCYNNGFSGSPSRKNYMTIFPSISQLIKVLCLSGNMTKNYPTLRTKIDPGLILVPKRFVDSTDISEKSVFTWNSLFFFKVYDTKCSSHSVNLFFSAEILRKLQYLLIHRFNSTVAILTNF